MVLKQAVRMELDNDDTNALFHVERTILQQLEDNELVANAVVKTILENNIGNLAFMGLAEVYKNLGACGLLEEIIYFLEELSRLNTQAL